MSAVTDKEVHEMDPAEEPAGGPPDRRNLRITIAVVVVVLLSSGIAIFYGLGWGRGEESTRDAGVNREDAVAAARSAAGALTTLDAGAPEESIEAWKDVTTGELHDAVASGESDFQALITTGDIDTASVVKDAAVESVDEEAETARVLVAVDVTLTPKRGRESLERLRLLVTVAEAEDGWKASELTTVDGSAVAAPAGDPENPEIVSDVSAAMVRLWSYDYRSLGGVGSLSDITTESFLDEYDSIYRRIEELAPATEAVVKARVSAIAVSAVEGDRATLLVFLDQRARKGDEPATDGEARLRVDAENIDGQWRVDGVTPF